MKSIIIFIVILRAALGNICGEQQGVKITLINEEVSNYPGGKPTPPDDFIDRKNLTFDKIKKMEKHIIFAKKVSSITINNGVMYFTVSNLLISGIFEYHYFYSNFNCLPRGCTLDFVEYTFPLLRFKRLLLTIEGNGKETCKNNIRKALENNMSCKILNFDTQYQTFEIIQKKTRKHFIVAEKQQPKVQESLPATNDLEMNDEDTLGVINGQQAGQKDPPRTIELSQEQEDFPLEFPQEQEKLPVTKETKTLSITEEMRQYFFETEHRIFKKSEKPNQQIKGNIVITYEKIQTPDGLSRTKASSIDFEIEGVKLTFDKTNSCFSLLLKIKNLVDGYNKECPANREYEFNIKDLKLDGNLVPIHLHQAALFKSNVIKLSENGTVEVDNKTYSFTIEPAPVWDNNRSLILKQVVPKPTDRYSYVVFVNFLNGKCAPKCPTAIKTKKVMRKKK
jgi:hypothetical protein